MKITVNTANVEKASYTVCLALTCVSCDIPATRKLCGFLSHRTTLACNKCMKCFPQLLESNGSFFTNCAGFDHEKFPKRTNTDHRQRCQEILFQEKGTKTALRNAVSSQGVSLELPYFVPMQNLFVGTGKHMMEVQLRHYSTNLSKDSISIIEGLACAFVIPEGEDDSQVECQHILEALLLLYASGIFFLKNIGNAGIYLLKQSR